MFIKLLTFFFVTWALPKPGDKAPDFKETCVYGKGLDKNPVAEQLSLSDLKGKWVILFFYPLDFTFVCPTEIIGFSDSVEKFEKLNAKVIGVSVDSEFTHMAWMATPKNEGGLGKDLKVPLIADLGRRMAYAYDVMLEDAGHTMRALFLIDPKGLVRHVALNDPPVGRNVDEALRLLQAFQFHERHGEVCPLNWSPGDDTIKPDPIKKLEFFGKNYPKKKVKKDL